MHALDALELDVARGTRATDPGLRPTRVQPGNRLRDRRHHLVSPDDQDVVVRDEREGTAALSGSCIEHDVPVSAMATAQVVSTSSTNVVLDGDRGARFVRNSWASQLRAGGSHAIGLLVLDVANPFFTEVARGVEQVMAERGLSVLLCNADSSVERQDRHLQIGHSDASPS